MIKTPIIKPSEKKTCVDCNYPSSIFIFSKGIDPYFTQDPNDRRSQTNYESEEGTKHTNSETTAKQESPMVELSKRLLRR